MTNIFFQIFRIFIFIFFQFYMHCEINQTISNVELEGIYRIDSLYNNCSFLVHEDQIFITKEKYGNNLLFFITPTFLNSYFIISWEQNKRLGTDNNNSLHLYNIEDKENIKRTYWNIIRYENNTNIFLIQNVFTQAYIETNKDPSDKVDISQSVLTFSFLKLFEEVQIRIIDIEMVSKEPIDVFIKYTDFTDKTLSEKGIKETSKENDMDKLKYCIRSILKYIPWIRKIFILIPNDKIEFLKPIEEIKDKFMFIKEKDLIGLDTINSAPLQFRLFELKKYGISENLIYMDDNYFIGGNLKKTDFFYYDDETQKVVPAIVNNYFSELNKQYYSELYNQIISQIDTINQNDSLGLQLSILSSIKLIIDNYNIPLTEVEFTHNALPLNINDLKEIYDLIINKYKYSKESLNSIENNIFILQPQLLFSLYGLNVKKRKVHSIEYNYLPLSQINNEYLNSKLIGIITEENDFTEEYRKGKKILASRFNFPNQYEIDFVEEKVTKIEDQSFYVNKTELKLIEDSFKFQLYYYIIIYWGLIIAILIVILLLLYYIYDLCIKINFSKKYNYKEIKQKKM